jgi:hypothetical protein
VTVVPTFEEESKRTNNRNALASRCAQG